MGSNKKKKYESDSSSESDSSNDSSSSEDRTNRKSHKKQKHSSDDSEPRPKKKYLEDSNGSESNKLRHRTSRKDDGKDADYKVKRNDYDSKHRSNDSNSHRHKERRPREDETEKKKESRHREFEEREKYNKDKRDDREYNRGKHNHRDRHDNRNRDRNREFDSNRREHNDDKYKRSENRRRRSSSFDHANAKWGKAETEKVEKKEPQPKDKPNFALSGKLTEETNTYRGVVIKYSEPPEARKPRRRWRLYPFKGEKALQTLYIHRESGYLIGRERKIVDLPVDHPSCSKQHAALQYRLVPFTRENGTSGKRVRPYLIDLDSANGTYINNKKIEPKKYYELFERDVIKFGYSSREYVLLHENSKDETLDDDVKMEDDDEAEVKVKKEP